MLLSLLFAWFLMLLTLLTLLSSPPHRPHCDIIKHCLPGYLPPAAGKKALSPQKKVFRGVFEATQCRRKYIHEDTQGVFGQHNVLKEIFEATQCRRKYMHELMRYDN